MAAVARLTWQAADPAAVAASLVQRLGVAVVPDRDRLAIPLVTAVLEVVPWRAEHPSDRPVPGGRLVLEPSWEEADQSIAVPATDDALRLLAIAWCTVELERAERDLAMWLEDGDHESGQGVSGDDIADPHLGAATRARRAPQLPGGLIVLAEPTTEGRVAASLARDAEGPCGLYLEPTGSRGLAHWGESARVRGAMTARPGIGPLGPQILVLGGPIAGPHLLVAQVARPRPSGQRRVPSSA